MGIKKNKPEMAYKNLAVYKGLKPEVVYCVFEGDEVLKASDVVPTFKPGHRRKSPVTGASYICRICICKCGVKRSGKHVLGVMCFSCQRKNNQKKNHIRYQEKKQGIKKLKKQKKYKCYGKKRVIKDPEDYDLDRFDCKRRIYCVDKFADVYEYIPCKNCGGYEVMDGMDRFLTVDRPEIEATRNRTCYS